MAAVCAEWEVRATVIGTVTEPEPDGGGRLRIRDGGTAPCWRTCPPPACHEDAPLYERPWRRRR